MPHPPDQDDELTVHDLVDDAVVPDAQPVTVVVPGKFLDIGIRAARILPQRRKRSQDRKRRRVRRLGTDTITLAGGSIPTDRRQIHVDCSAAGLPAPPPRPIFEPGRIALQLIRAYQPTFSAALAAFVETARTHDTERNALCPANPYPSAAEDWIRTTLISQQAQAAWSAPDISGWLDRSRLDAARGIGDHAADPRLQASLHRLFASMKPAVDNLARLA